jgi:hypothetical protein
VRAALAILAAWALGCNAILGISDTSFRGDAGSAGLGAVPVGTGGLGATNAVCQTNADCLAQTGEPNPSACVDGHCVLLFTPECPTVYPQTERLWLENLRHSDPDPVIFGVFSSVPSDLLGIDGRNYDLVLTEVSHAVGGLPAAGGKRRPVLAVACHYLYKTPDGLDRAIDHLIGELHVPAILAGLEARDLEYAFRRQGLDQHVFFVSPYDADRALAELDDDNLVWEMLSGGEQLAPAYAPLLDRTLAHLRATGRLASDGLARVALVTTQNVSALAAMSSALTGGILQFNGRSASENAPDYFRAVSITSSTLATAAPDYTAAIQLLRDFSPHVIISAASSEFITTIIPALEAEAPELEPFYLLSPWEPQDDLMDALLTRLPDIYARLAGVNFASAADSTAYDAYQARFDAAFPAFAGTRGFENFYDAGYYLIHAAAAAGTTAPLRGSDLVNGMRRLLSGPPTFTVGPDDLLPAFVALETAGSSIELDGTMGPPNFDPRTGGRDEPGSVWCVEPTHTIETDVLRLDAQGNLTGTFPCFDFPEP